METSIPKIPSTLGIISDNKTSEINNIAMKNPGTHNPIDTTTTATDHENSILSAIFNTTISPPTLYFDDSHDFDSTSKSNQVTVEPLLNWSASAQTKHEYPTSYTSAMTTNLPANVTSFPIMPSVPAAHDGLSSMRVATSTTTATTTASSTIRSTSEPNWDDRALVAGALFILALSLVAVALRIFCPIYHRIMGHNTSKTTRERHYSYRDPMRNTDAYDREEMTPSIHSDEVLLPFGTPATVMQPAMNFGHPYNPYQYPLTYIPYPAAAAATASWFPQAYEQECIVTQHIQPDIPQGETSGHQADKLVEILEFPSEHLKMGAFYRQNWDQMFDGVTNESMLSYIGHPSEYRTFPTRYNTHL